MTASILPVLAVRYLLVMLFFPFSALDKILNFKGAVRQAGAVAPRPVAVLLVIAGLTIEVSMSLAILTGTADRAAAVILAGYCMITALLWKQFWKPGDFWAAGDSQARTLFWDFLKNVSLAGGFLLLVTGAHGNFPSFLANPFASSHPYTQDTLP